MYIDRADNIRPKTTKTEVWVVSSNVTKIQKLRRIYPTEAYVESQENSDEDLHIQIEEIQNRLQIKIKIKRYLFFALVAINILLFGLGVSYHYNALLNDA